MAVVVMLCGVFGGGGVGHEALQVQTARGDAKGCRRRRLGRAGRRRDHAVGSAVAGERRGEKHGCCGCYQLGDALFAREVTTPEGMDEGLQKE